MADIRSLDRLGQIEYSEKAGVPDSLTRVAVVDNFDDSSPEAAVNDILTAAGGAFGTMPAAGDTITVGSDDVVLEDRTVTIAASKKATVTLLYKRQDLVVIGGGLNDFEYRGAGAMEAAERTMDFSTVDPAPLFVEWDGRRQGGRISFAQPVQTLEVELVEETDNPMQIVAAYAGKVNLTAWASGQEREWLCAGVRYDVVNRISTPQKWRMRYSFLWKPGGHDPTIAVTDPSTGELPASVIPGQPGGATGDQGDVQVYGAPNPSKLGAYRVVHSYPALDFNVKFA